MPSGRGPLRVAFEDFIKTYKFPKEQQQSFLRYADEIETTLFEFVGRQLPRYGVPSNMASKIMNDLGKRNQGEALPILAGLLFVFVGFFTGIFNNFIEPVNRSFEYAGNELMPNNRMDISSIMAAYFRRRFNAPDFTKRMAQHGFDPLEATHLLESSRPLLTENEVILGLWRGKFDETGFKNYLSKRGWVDDDIDRWREFAVNIPGISDLIRFLVRDVTNEGVVRKYGYDEGWPNNEIIQAASKQGYDEKWAKYYWYAHYNLPSPTQAYVMLHRGEIDRPIMDELLRIADYPPFWRQKLINISYNPLRLVDIRGAFRNGVIDYATMVRKFKDRGANDEDATIQANLVVAASVKKERDLTVQQLQDSYFDGTLDRNGTKAEMRKLGYDDRESDILLDRVETRIEKQRLEDEIEFIHQRFLANLISEADVRGALSTLNVPFRRVDILVLRWNREKDIKPRLPSRNDYEVFAKKRIISLEQYRDGLYRLGYREPDVTYYLREVQSDLE